MGVSQAEQLLCWEPGSAIPALVPSSRGTCSTAQDSAKERLFGRRGYYSVKVGAEERKVIIQKAQ